MKLDVAIIGAGHNGLIAATYLARAGLKVQIFERRDFPGGATLNEELWPGYTFSTCAHLMHAFPAKLVKELGLIERGLVVDRRDEVIYLNRDGTYHTYLDQNCPNHLTSKAKLTAEEQAALARYDAFKLQLIGLVRPYLLTLPPTAEELRQRAAGTPAAEALRLATTMSLWELQDHFLPTARLRERCASELSAVAADPSAFTLAYTAIAHPDPVTGEKGPWGFVKGGMGCFAALLVEAAEEAGVKINTDCAVQEILVQDGRTHGLLLVNGQTISADQVLSCIDPKATFLKLLGPASIDPDLRNRIAGLNTQVGCCKFLAATNALPQWTGWDGDPDLPARGAVQLEMTRESVCLAHEQTKAGIPPKRPMMSVNVPSSLDPNLAPAGHHTISVYVYPAPAKPATDNWDDHREAVAQGIIDQITEYAPNFRNSVLHYELRTPLDLERKVGLTDGCIWHLQHDADQLFAQRPLPELSNYRTPVAGFYLGGSGQHPGGEVSGCPGHNSAHEILKDLRIS
jgi:phytoene dehydrogenase-like protein